MAKGLTPIATRMVALAVVGACTVAVTAAPSASPDKVAYFETHIRPLLAEHCYECHSAGAKKLKANLRLDHRGGWMTGGDSGPPIVPRDADASLLIKAVGYKDVELQMPPKYRLPPEAVAKLTKWIEDGAIDPRNPPEGDQVAKPRPGIDLEAGREHWAYQPIVKPALPRVTDTAWPINDIDHFILAELERNNLKPGDDADKVTLVRRLYFVLTGLPPTPQQIDTFVNDPRTDAYERLVDQLLASPRYGERWGRHWLDVARYAESLTLRGFVLTDAWRYRDYIIKSFNADRPFDQLMQEQVAGDLMPAADDDERRRNIVATAFLALGNNNLEEQDKKTLEMDVVDEQLETVGRAFLGQTIGCARCHDHKFDPIPTLDYYAMAGIFKNTIAMTHSNVSAWIQADLPMPPERERAVAEHDARVAAMQAQVDALKKEVAKLGGSSKAPPAMVSVGELEGIVLDNTHARIVGEWKESTHTPRWVGDGYLADISDRSQPMTVTYQPDLPAPGKYELRMSYSAGEGRPSNTKVIVFSAAGETTLTINQRQLPGVDGVFHSLGVYDFESKNQGYVIITNEGANGNTIADAVQFLPVPRNDKDAGEKPKVAKAEGAAAADKNEAEVATARLKEMERDLKKLKEAAPPRDRVIAIKEAPAAEIADVRIHIRGSRHSLGEVAPRGFLQVIDIGETISVPDDQSGRLQLAAWLAHPRNPLPPRVTANRIWHWAMGAGLVRTPDNFGTTGEPPTHPALLDHLATQLTQHNWSIKQLVRQIVLSRTFRLSSADTHSGGAAKDPENRLWWRANHRRLEAECIRDAMLAVSGSLDLALFGQTYDEGRSSDFGFQYDGHRRSVYVPAFRNALPDALALFDAADTSVPTGRRDVSTVSPQALYMMNSPFVLEQSQAAAELFLADDAPADEHASITRAYRQTLGRVPSSSELSLIQRHLERCRTSNIPEQQAWAEVFHALFGSIEFRYLK